ncbi:hypothetical protein B0H14DRAFT_3487394 [Mycena olivaceomarginata]|nr:hypothetical protein B0H14DRAFT_3487394 [Mycena olivaceomarginata]
MTPSYPGFPSPLTVVHPSKPCKNSFTKCTPPLSRTYREGGQTGHGQPTSWGISRRCTLGSREAQRYRHPRPNCTSHSDPSKSAAANRDALELPETPDNTPSPPVLSSPRLASPSPAIQLFGPSGSVKLNVVGPLRSPLSALVSCSGSASRPVRVRVWLQAEERSALPSPIFSFFSAWSRVENTGCESQITYTLPLSIRVRSAPPLLDWAWIGWMHPRQTKDAASTLTLLRRLLRSLPSSTTIPSPPPTGTRYRAVYPIRKSGIHTIQSTSCARSRFRVFRTENAASS